MATTSICKLSTITSQASNLTPPRGEIKEAAEQQQQQQQQPRRIEGDGLSESARPSDVIRSCSRGGFSFPASISFRRKTVQSVSAESSARTSVVSVVMNVSRMRGIDWGPSYLNPRMIRDEIDRRCRIWYQGQVKYGRGGGQRGRCIAWCHAPLRLWWR